MGRSGDEGPRDPEQPGNERRRLARTREVLELLGPLVAVLMTLGSALLKLAVERLPTLEPIGVVLVVSLVFLVVSALVQLALFWGELATPLARAEFLRRLSFGVLLAFVTLAGLLARYLFELFRSGRSVADADPAALAMPLLVSLMVFYPLWARLSGPARGFFPVVAAFQNGFFWQTMLSGFHPFAGPSL